MWPGQRERFGAGVGVNMAVQKSAVALSPQRVLGWSIMKAGDNVPERPHTFRAGSDKSVATSLVKPTFYHGIVTWNHVRIVKAGDVISGINQGTFLCEGKCFRKVFYFGQLFYTRILDTAVEAAQICIHSIIVPGLIVFKIAGVSLIKMVLGRP